MKYFHHLATFQNLLGLYDAEIPLARFLATYFRAHKNMGSQDRKFASRYLYSYFRAGKAFAAPSLEINLALADFLCNTSPSPIGLHFLNIEEAAYIGTLDEKLAWVKEQDPTFDLTLIFNHESLSEGISTSQWQKKLLIQPKLFIRVDEKQRTLVLEKLEMAKIPFETLGSSCIAFANGTKLESVLSPNEYQIQDYASQQTGTYYQPNPHEHWWDCCAASGGKSLLLNSIEPTVKLLVSDIRAQSLVSLQQRFMAAGIKKFQCKTMDLLQNNKAALADYLFDGILVDAPCTGSGTWPRTPEQNYFFEEAKIMKYANLQRQIIQKVLAYLKPGKALIYSTCSVFKAENEDNIHFILKNNPDMMLEKMELMNGIEANTDAMFVARLIKKASILKN